MPVITLPDGSQRTYSEPVSVEKVAADIGPGLAKAALAGKVDDKLVDTSYLIDREGRVAAVEEGFHDERAGAIEQRIRALLERH